MKASQDKNWTHTHTRIGVVTVEKKTNVHITFSMNSKQMKVCLCVLMSPSPRQKYLKLIYFTAALFTTSLLRLLWSQGEDWMEAADVKQSHAGWKTGTGAVKSFLLFILKSGSNWVGTVINLVVPECYSELNNMPVTMGWFFCRCSQSPWTGLRKCTKPPLKL